MRLCFDRSFPHRLGWVRAEVIRQYYLVLTQQIFSRCRENQETRSLNGTKPPKRYRWKISLHRAYKMTGSCAVHAARSTSRKFSTSKSGVFGVRRSGAPKSFHWLTLIQKMAVHCVDSFMMRGKSLWYVKLHCHVSGVASCCFANFRIHSKYIMTSSGIFCLFCDILADSGARIDLSSPRLLYSRKLF